MFIDFNQTYTGNEGTGKFWSLYPQAPELYSVKGGSNYSIDRLPYADDNTVVDLGIKAGVNANYTLTAVDINEFYYAKTVLLEDLKTGAVRELKSNPVYTFSASPGDEQKRFKLHFGGPYKVNEMTKNPSFTIYNIGSTIFINNNSDMNCKTSVCVFNMIGQKILQKWIGDKKTRIDLQVIPGCYLVTLISDEQVVSRKVLIRD